MRGITGSTDSASFISAGNGSGRKELWAAVQGAVFSHPNQMEARMGAETAHPKKFLLVKDGPQAIELTLAGLEKNHLTKKFAIVSNGGEALDYLYCRGRFKSRAAGLPTLVLLDNKLPKASGLQMLKTMKLDERFKAIPVVVLTCWRTAPDLIEFFRHGAQAYAVKSQGFSQFIRAVKRLDVLWVAVRQPLPLPGREAGVQAGEMGVLAPI